MCVDVCRQRVSRFFVVVPMLCAVLTLFVGWCAVCVCSGGRGRRILPELLNTSD